MKTIQNQKPGSGRSRAFTLIELLVVIAIISVLAAFTIPVLKTLKQRQNINVARAEMQRIETALENYKAKYGVYPPSNQNLDSYYLPQNDRSQFNQLYYELSGMQQETIGGTPYFVTLDGSSQIKVAEVHSAYGVDGFINLSKGSDEDAKVAQNFLPDLKPNLYNSYVTNSGVRTTELVTSVGGPDQNYQPLKAPGINPYRYLYPGVNNPKSYDLWVQLVMAGKTNLICNWKDQVQINSPLP
jgi:type II secretion system protein G